MHYRNYWVFGYYLGWIIMEHNKEIYNLNHRQTQFKETVEYKNAVNRQYRYMKDRICEPSTNTDMSNQTI